MRYILDKHRTETCVHIKSVHLYLVDAVPPITPPSTVITPTMNHIGYHILAICKHWHRSQPAAQAHWWDTTLGSKLSKEPIVGVHICRVMPEIFGAFCATGHGWRMLEDVGDQRIQDTRHKSCDKTCSATDVAK